MTDGPNGAKVLVADCDAPVARFLAGVLRDEGFAVEVVTDGFAALAAVEADRPDIVLLDLLGGERDLCGLEVCRRLRADPVTAGLPVIMLTACDGTADVVSGLTAGADDYVVKPFDTLELVARLRATLRRNREIGAMSPLTGLPGNARILAEIAARSRSGDPYAVCYVDLDNFKSVNDAYGFLRGDRVITTLASVLYAAARRVGPPVPFLGHVGGDDFVLICTPAQVTELTGAVITLFEAEVPGFYDPADLQRGYLEMPDRQGRLKQFALLTVSIGVACAEQDAAGDHHDVVSVAAEMKAAAKGTPGSAVAVS
jgi:DNA-binding response OmpR family regulator